MNRMEEINFDTDPNLQGNVQMSLQSFTLTWTLNYLGASQKSIFRRYFSPFFYVGDSIWQIHLIIVSENDSEAEIGKADPQNLVISQSATNTIDEIIVYVARHSSEKDSCCMKYKISLLDDEGCIATREGEEIRKWIDCSFQSMEKNIFASFMKKDTLFVRCELTTLSPMPVNPVSSTLKRSANAGEVGTKSAYSNVNHLQQSINSRPVTRYTFQHTKPRRNYNLAFFTDIVAVVIIFGLIYFALDLTIGESFDKMPTPDQVYTELKIEEINKYIADSALKIHDIARALNLTELERKIAKLREHLITYLSKV